MMAQENLITAKKSNCIAFEWDVITYEVEIKVVVGASKFKDHQKKKSSELRMVQENLIIAKNRTFASHGMILRTRLEKKVGYVKI